MDKKPIRVLAIEDSIQQALQLALRPPKYQLTIVDSHDIAKEDIENGDLNPSDFDVILNDVDTSSSVHGAKFAHWLREQRCAAPIIMMTSHAEMAKELQDAGIVQGAVNKPFSNQDLLSAISWVCNAPQVNIDAQSVQNTPPDKDKGKGK